MGTKNSPGAYDCYSALEPDEPYFVLMARDPMASSLVRMWAVIRQEAIEKNLKPNSDIEKVLEAKGCAESMEVWRARNRQR